MLARMIPELFARIAAGAEIITPTRRLSRYLHYHYAQHCLQQGLQSWQRPAILPWSGWCRQHWQVLSLLRANDRVLLSQTQQRCIWQRIIESSPDSRHCLYPLATTTAALRSYRLFRQYCLPDAGEAPVDDRLDPLREYQRHTLDTRAFQGWLRQYLQWLEGRKLIDEDSLPEWIADHARTLSGRTLVCYGFDGLNPQQRRFFARLGAAGVRIETLSAERGTNARVCALAFGSVRAEIRAAVHWAEGILRQQEHVRIGILCMEIGAQRSLLLQELELGLGPRALLHFHDDPGCVYTISAGLPLRQYPPIYAALSMLRLAAGQSLSASELGTVLLSPWLQGMAQEYHQRARFDARLRDSHRQTMTLGQLNACLRHQGSTVPLLAERLRALSESVRAAPGEQSAADWARTFAQWLRHVLQWSRAEEQSEQGMDSQVWQLRNAWHELLEELASLQDWLPQLRCQQALTQLSRLSEERRFQAETHETPVQIMGLEGAAGMRFDYLWLLGMHDQNWPPAARPDPFIALPLQIRAGLPQVSAQSQCQWAQTLTQGLCRSARHLVFSYPEQEGERELRPSPLIHCPVQPGSDATEVVDYRHQVLRSARLEWRTDHPPPVVCDGSSGERQHGGSGLLKDQGDCPFRAFARYRLQARGLEPFGLVPDAAQRGDLMHALMQRLWQELGDSDTLHRQDEAALQTLLKKLIAEVFAARAYPVSAVSEERFRQLEEARLIRHVLSWLALERQRGPFQVEALERREDVVFHGLRLRLYIDRIDRLPDGRLLIIDYKTGEVKESAWDGVRPDEPQLPLYALVQTEPVAAIGFAVLKAGTARYCFVGEQEDLLPGTAQNKQKRWSELLSGWRDSLTMLADEFCAGRADVAPKAGERTCKYCDLHTLCRTHERRLLLDRHGVGEDDAAN